MDYSPCICHIDSQGVTVDTNNDVLPDIRLHGVAEAFEGE